MTAFNLRLPPALEEDARVRATQIGISLNAICCIALDAYVYRDKPLEAIERPELAPYDGPSGLPGPTPQKAPRADSIAKANKVKPPPQRPGPNATKKIKAAYHNWQRDQGKLDGI